ncbi:MAG TPA: PQQ-binding-like beta-propeller repeat protein [Chroococcidiopsis sp.]
MEHSTRLPKIRWRSLLTGVVVLGAVGWVGAKILSWPVPYVIAVDAQTGDVDWTMLQPNQQAGVSRDSWVWNLPTNAAIADQHLLTQRTISRYDDASNSTVYYWQLTASDADSGKQQWVFQDQKSVEHSAPVLYTHDNMLYAFLRQENYSGNSELVAIDLNTGQLQWKIKQYWTPDIIAEPGIVASGDRAIFLKRIENGNAQLQAVEAQTGQPLWKAPIPPPAAQGNSSHSETSNSETGNSEQGNIDYLFSRYALRANDRTVFLLGWDTIYAYDLQTGKLQNRWDGSNTYRIEATNQTLYVVGFDRITAFDLATGQAQWSYGGSKGTCQQPQIAPSFQLLVTADQLYSTCIDFQGTWLLALDRTSGKRQWMRRISTSSPAEDLFPPQRLTANRELVFLFKSARQGWEPDEVMALSTQDGELRWNLVLHDAPRLQSLINSGDRLYLYDIAPRWRSWLMHLAPQWF